MKFPSFFRKRKRETASPPPQPSRLPRLKRAHAPQTCSLLLSLPPELRNQIYTEVLISRSADVEITTSSHEPALLQTCKQVRAEARPLYYFSNSFRIAVRDCEATGLTAFCEAVIGLQARHPGAEERPVALTIEIVGRPDWGNLMKWCRYVFEHRETALLVDGKDGEDLYETVVSAALGIAADCKCARWEEVGMALRLFRALVAEVDRRWLDS